jgi:hypothetical protein
MGHWHLRLPGRRILQDDDRRPRLHIPVVAALIAALAVMNVTSAVLGMID